MARKILKRRPLPPSFLRQFEKRLLGPKTIASISQPGNERDFIQAKQAGEQALSNLQAIRKRFRILGGK